MEARLIAEETGERMEQAIYKSEQVSTCLNLCATTNQPSIFPPQKRNGSVSDPELFSGGIRNRIPGSMYRIVDLAPESYP